MFLNDAVDEAFDRRYRPERPIVSGQIGSRTVWILSCVWLVAGWVAFLPLGKSALFLASFLLLAIVLYDVIHKRTELAPLLMAACRFLLYLLAASTAIGGANPSVRWRAAALAGYIVGLSFLARGESTGGARRMRWTVGLLLAPVFVAFVRRAADGWGFWSAALLQAGWTVWCLWAARPKLLSSIPHGVAALLAGIVLVDWLAAAGQGFAAAFLGLFLLALLLQRVAPAT
jgi:4-hydroxybenzoate polyprenyltransferase